MEFIKIVLISIVAAATYGVGNNLVTAHLCIEFFELFPLDVKSDNPIVIAVTYGVLTTWWVGLILGLLVATAARIGETKKLGAFEVVRPIVKLIGFVALIALLFGLGGYAIAENFTDQEELKQLFSVIPPEKHRVAFAVNAAHIGAYGGGGYWRYRSLYFVNNEAG